MGIAKKICMFICSRTSFERKLVRKGIFLADFLDDLSEIVHICTKSSRDILSRIVKLRRVLLSDKLKELRCQAKQSQQKDAAALDIDTATYSKIENGKYMPNRDLVLWLASFFGFDSEQLIKLWLADRVVEMVKDKQVAPEAMKLAVKIINEHNAGNKDDAKV